MMNNPAQNQAKPGNAVSGSLIRVDQVPKLPHLNDAEKAQTQARVQQMWDIMNNNAETDLRRRQAHQHLTAMSQQIMQAMRAYNEQQKQSQQMRQQTPAAPQRTHTAPNPMVPQAQPQSQPHIPPAQTQSQPQAQPASTNPVAGQFLPEVQQQLDVYQFCLPPAMTQGTKQADEWLKEAKSRFGSALQRMQQAKTQKANLQRLAMTKQQQQGGLSVTEQNTFNDKVAQFNKYIAESQTFLEKFREQQTQFKAQRAQMTTPHASNIPPNDPPKQQTPATGQSSLQQPSQSISQQSTNTSPVPTTSGTTAIPGQSNQPNSQSLPNTPGAAQPSAYPGTPGQQQQRLQYPNHAGPGSLSAPGAVNTDTAQPTAPMQPASHGQMNRPNFTSPVGQAPQRSITEPSLSAISGYALDQSEDGSVLSKRKLRELVGEVLGKDSDGITTDAEDLCVQFVDDFVDDILSQGCKIAKLRGANHLDARDIQVVLERQYNMRIPGFSTDELRVARRPQPSSGWTQKLASVNSSK